MNLLPCPFCGGEARLTSYSSLQSLKKYGDKIHWIICANKCAASGYNHDTKEEAIKAWNTRTNSNDDDPFNELSLQLKRVADALERSIQPMASGGFPIVRHIHEYPR